MLAQTLLEVVTKHMAHVPYCLAPSVRIVNMYEKLLQVEKKLYQDVSLLGDYIDYIKKVGCD